MGINCVFVDSSQGSFGQVPGLALGHDGPSGPERREPGLPADADCDRRSESL